MRVSVRFAPDEAKAADMEGTTAVVIDVVRATSCIAEALAAGAASVHPAVSVDEAVRLRSELEGGRGSDRPLLCGERRGLRIEGFDLGNSPAEFTPGAVGGRRLVMTTTNGTRALAAARPARRVLAASFLNLGAIVEAVRGDGAVAIVCAGKEGRFAIDDVVCAGSIVRRLLDGSPGGAIALDEAAQASADLARLHGISAAMLAASEAGRALVRAGLGADLEHCARLDRHDVVPALQDGRITADADRRSLEP